MTWLDLNWTYSLEYTNIDKNEDFYLSQELVFGIYDNDIKPCAEDEGQDYYYFEIIHKCPANGNVLYTISHGDYGGAYYNSFSATCDLSIEDNEDCSEGGYSIGEDCLSKSMHDQIQNESSSCGCSSLSSDDPAGMLTAMMMLFAFFALAFERIRRKK